MRLMKDLVFMGGSDFVEEYARIWVISIVVFIMIFIVICMMTTILLLLYAFFITTHP